MRCGKSWLMFGLLLLLVGCHHQQQSPQTAKWSNSYFLHANLQTVTSVEVRGPFDLKICPNRRRASADLRGMPELLSATNIQQDGSRLIISLNPVVLSQEAAHKRVLITLNVNQLHKIRYVGTGSITAHGMETPMIDIDADTSGPINLSGKLGIRELKLAGTGMVKISGLSSNDLVMNVKGNHWIRVKGFADLRQLVAREKARVSLYWLEGKSMEIETYDEAYVQVAGKADQMEIKAYNTSFVNAKYLRSTKTFAKAFDGSRVNLQVIHGQHALASGDSNIYYYKIPEIHSDYMMDDGSILFLEERRWFNANVASK